MMELMQLNEIPKVKFGTAMTIVMGFELSEELSLMIAGYKSQLKMEF